jgi:1-acyl-sn-glycerol-3-phosphate acyltransferase
MNTERSLFWKCLQVVARILTTLLFQLKVYGRRNVPRRGGVLVVSNHQGNLDPVIMAVRLERPLNYIAKSELFENRYSAALLRALNAFPVRQGAGDVGAVRETIHRLQEGHLLNIYPEGCRTPDGEISELQKGVALIIRRAGVPVIPAVIMGSFEAWPIHRDWLRPWPVRIRYGPPMEFDGQDADQIIATLDRTLREMYGRLRLTASSATAARPRLASAPCR